MPNALDYIDWRGDLPFCEYPVTPVDEMIIAFIGKPDFTGIIPADAEQIELWEASARYFEKHPDMETLGLLASQEVLPMLKKLADAPRYRNLKLSLFSREVSVGETKQFSALTVRVPGGMTYITFRGTDDTLTGWKENFRIAVSGAVPAQEDAIAYLHRAARCFDGPLVVNGHSKGGNLAIYAAAHMPADIQSRIQSVISYDGPGFLDAFLKSEGYCNIQNKTTTISPENSIVGMLLGRAGRLSVVRANTSGVVGHDGLTWETNPNGFSYAERLSEGSIAFRDAAKETLGDMTTEDVEELVDGLFTVLDASGAVTVSDFTENIAKKAIDTVRGLKQQPAVYRFFLKLLGGTLKNRGTGLLGKLGLFREKGAAAPAEAKALPETAEPAVKSPETPETAEPAAESPGLPEPQEQTQAQLQEQ